jgi:hypothetical protein
VPFLEILAYLNFVLMRLNVMLRITYEQSIETLDPADVEIWLSKAINNVVDGPVSAFLLPPTVPGSTNPLLWWTTPNLVSIDFSLLAPGIETMYAMLFKAGIQRTYVAQGMSCPRQTTTGTSSLKMTSIGVTIMYFYTSIQTFIVVMAMMCYIVWFISPYPLGPAIRATHDYIYFVTLLAPTQMTTGLYELGNSESFFIWQELDIFGRIGEAIHTIDQPSGRIVLDNPNLIRPLQNGRKYH